MVKLVFFAAVVVVCVAAGPLLADVYKCDINAGASQGNWIAARYSFDF